MNYSKPLVRALGATVLLGVALSGSGCASIVHGGPRNIAITSQPAGAKVTVAKVESGEIVHGGVTPMTVTLSPRRGFFKGQNYNLKLELPGYQSAEVAIRSELSGWYFGNIIFGGLIGMLIVDPATGAMWNLSPENVDRSLNTQQVAMLKNGDGFLVVMVSETTAQERANMVRIN